MDTEYLNSNALLAYDKGKADGIEQERQRLVEIFSPWLRAMASVDRQNILDRIEGE